MAVAAQAGQSEVGAAHGVPVLSGHLVQNRVDIGEWNVNGCSTVLANQVVVPGVLGEVEDAGTMTKMDVMEEAQRFEGVERSIDGALVYRTSECPARPVSDVGSAQMLVAGGGDHLADGLARFGYPHTFGAQGCDQLVHPAMVGTAESVRL